MLISIRTTRGNVSSNAACCLQLVRVLWATGARISEALDLRLVDVRRDSVVLPNLKNPSRICRARCCSGPKNIGSQTVSHSSSHAKVRQVGGRPISRQQAWEIVRAA